MRKAALLVVLVAGLSVFAGFLGTGNALAYGSQDGPIAQVEVSFNCMNATYCKAPLVPETFGLWIWAEVDSGGSLDYTLSGCGHTVGGGGPGSAGGGGSPEHGTWDIADNFADAMASSGFNIPFAVALNSSGGLADSQYYVMHLHDPVLGDFNGIVPATPGHYNVSGLQLEIGHPVPGIATQTQIAPVSPN